MFPNQFSFTLANNSGSAVIVAFFAGTLSTLGFAIIQNGSSPYDVSAITEHQHNKAALVEYGVNVDAILDDGTIATSVVATSGHPSNKIRNFRQYIKDNPQFLRQIIIQSNNTAALGESLVYRRQTPLGDTGAKSIPLAKYLSEMQPNEKRITARFDRTPGNSIILASETILYTKIPANTSMTYLLDMEPVS